MPTLLLYISVFAVADQPYDIAKRDAESALSFTPKKLGRFARHTLGPQGGISFEFAKRTPLGRTGLPFAFDEPSIDEERFARFARAAFAFAKRSQFAFA
ncbi:unnamed protein product [Anisakis simplex]|uniref:DNA primase n=1 Tax=Anisakis simplex TaxID=6269 RepID=A0A0M3KBG1_ANISI|nr:unnamed protein product [Anisakis simplex]